MQCVMLGCGTGTHNCLLDKTYSDVVMDVFTFRTKSVELRVMLLPPLFWLFFKKNQCLHVYLLDTYLGE